MYVALIASGAALALLVALVLASRRHAGALAPPFVPALAIPFVGLYVFAYATRGIPWWSRGDEHRAATLFRDVVMLDAAAAALGAGAAVAALLLLALRTSHQLRLLRLALPCAMLGVAAASGIRHADALVAVGAMPFYGVDGERSMHVGRERDVRVRLMRPPGRRFWSGMEDGPRPVDEHLRDAWTRVERVHVRATAEGRVPFTAAARRGPVTLTTRLHVVALPETASPLLSLRVGDHAAYRVRARSSDGAFLFFITLSGGERVHEVTVDVTTTREREGFRTFVIAVAREGKQREVEVVALNGETRLYDAETGKVGAPVVAFANGESSAPDPIACSFALLDAPSAVCQRGGREADVPAPAFVSTEPSRGRRKGDSLARPPVAFAGAAPAAFEMHRSSTAGGIATAFVAIVTIGLVILPDGSSSTSYTLVSTRRGPEGAPEAQPGEHRAMLSLP